MFERDGGDGGDGADGADGWVGAGWYQGVGWRRGRPAIMSNPRRGIWHRKSVLFNHLDGEWKGESKDQFNLSHYGAVVTDSSTGCVITNPWGILITCTVSA